MIDWYGGTDEDRAHFKLWVALRLPMQFRTENGSWEDQDRDDWDIMVHKPIPYRAGKNPQFAPGIKFRLKPDGN